MANPTPSIPGAINLTADQLTGDMIVTIGAGSPQFAQTTLDSLAEFVQASDAGPADGTFVMDGATPVEVANENVTADSVILITLKTVGGAPAASFISGVTPGTGFEVTGTAGDTSTYNYKILG